MLNADSPRVMNSDTKVGLYIELKNYYAQEVVHRQDIAVAVDKVLKANNLGTIADCKDEIPIIIQGFQLDSLKKYATLSDLPLVFLTGSNDGVDW